jgi:hypothetical protein
MRSHKFAALLLLLTLAALPSCKALGLTAPAPAKLWVQSARATYLAVGKEYAAYVLADPLLTEEQKQLRIESLSDWDFNIRQGELLHDLALPAISGAQQ